MIRNEPLPSWPPVLGLPLNSGYRHSIHIAASVAMMAGISRTRRTIETPVSEFSLSFIWTDDQLKRFRQFAGHEIDGTADWFVMPLWTGGEVQQQTVRVKTLNKYQLTLPYWSASLVVECPNRDLLPDDIGDALLDWSPSDLIEAGKQASASQCRFGKLFEHWDDCRL